MYSSEDLESFYFQYQTEALPHGESLQSFCVKNKVPYNIFRGRLSVHEGGAERGRYCLSDCLEGRGFDS